MLILEGRVPELAIKEEVTNAAKKLCATPDASSFLCNLSVDGLRALDSEYSRLIFLRPLRYLRAASEAITDDEIVIRGADSDCLVEHRLLHCYTIPTDYLRTIFEDRRATLSTDLSVQLFEALSTHALTRTSVGWRHEFNVHKRLCTIEKPLDIVRSGERRPIQPSSRLLAGTLLALSEIEAGESFYWIPSVANFPGVDGVLATGQDLYAVQANVASKHVSPAKGLKKVWTTMGAEVRGQYNWHVVFITRDTEPAPLVEAESSSPLTLGAEKASVTVWGCIVTERDGLKRKRV